MTTANDRLVELKQERTDRLYSEAVTAAGFDNSLDYDAWLVLEELRKLTLAERKAAEDKLNPPKLSGGIVINGRLADYSAVTTSITAANLRGPVGSL